MSQILLRAEERVTEALRVGKVSNKTGMTDKERWIETLSFPVSLMFVKSTKLDHLVGIYALAEAKRCEQALYNENKDSTVDFIFQKTLGIDLKKIGGKNAPMYSIGIADYVNRAVRFHKPEWKLLNRRVDGGRVSI